MQSCKGDEDMQVTKRVHYKVHRSSTSFISYHFFPVQIYKRA